jgi:hypothetical protein
MSNKNFGKKLHQLWHVTVHIYLQSTSRGIGPGFKCKMHTIPVVMHHMLMVEENVWVFPYCTFVEKATVYNGEKGSLLIHHEVWSLNFFRVDFILKLLLA